MAPIAASPDSRSILVVDDDAPVRFMLTRVLRAQGYHVVDAASALDATRAIELSCPDLVIADVVMPGASGIELRDELAVRWPAMPVILMSGFSADRFAELVGRETNTPFVPKPFGIGDLLSAVHSMLV